MKKTNRLVAFVTTVIIIFSCFFYFPMSTFASAEVTPSGVDISKIETIVDDIMEGKIGVTVPGAAVSIVKDGRLIFSKGYGVANIKEDIPVDPTSTVFEIGSVSKIFTWTAVMQLVEEGKIDLHTDIREYIGYERLNLVYDKPITILDLMNHTAGFEENASEMLTFDKEKVIPLEKWVSAKHQPKQIYEPGAVIAYSNFGTDIAGYIVEVKSGERFEEYVKKHIFDPLHMQRSTAYANYYHLPEFAENKSKGYGSASKGFELLPENFLNEAPAGAIISTAEDMAKFMIAQMDYEGALENSLFNSPQMLKEMHADSLSVSAGMPSNAHGFWLRQENGVRLLEHGGNTTNFSAFLSLVPEENFGVSVLTNVAGESEGVRTEIVDTLSAQFSHQAKVIVPNLHTQNLSGTYYSGRMIHSNFLSSLYLVSGDSIVVKDMGNGEIEVRPSIDPNRETLHFAEVAPLVFERMDSNPSILERSGGSLAFLSFELDENGQVDKVRTGNIRDYLKMPLYKNIQLNQIAFVFCIIIFITGSIAALISVILLRKRKKKGISLNIPAYKQTNLLPVIGLLSMINMIVTILRFMSAMSSPIGDFRIHLIINAVFSIGMIIAAIPILKSFRDKQVSGKRKIWNAILIATICMFILLMIQYRFLLFWTI
ncbi:serine hydrolase domain-containing protein [Lysinibacillus sp. NPDC097231]|uniref:serine hydrolase domain-containing protein n=1 Tax=Lysinibacillus sp. NPDC097231 TaxID=3364142 RepID=UPI00381CA3E2